MLVLKCIFRRSLKITLRIQITREAKNNLQSFSGWWNEESAVPADVGWADVDKMGRITRCWGGESCQSSTRGFPCTCGWTVVWEAICSAHSFSLISFLPVSSDGLHLSHCTFCFIILWFISPLLTQSSICCLSPSLVLLGLSFFVSLFFCLCLCLSFFISLAIQLRSQEHPENRWTIWRCAH